VHTTRSRTASGGRAVDGENGSTAVVVAAAAAAAAAAK